MPNRGQKRARKVAAYNRRIRHLSPEQKEALLSGAYRQFYEQTLDPIFRTGGVSPLLNIINEPVTVDTSQGPQVYPGATGPSDNGMRQMRFSIKPLMALLLKNKNKNAQFYNRYLAKKMFAHETAHVFQNRDLYYQNRDLSHDAQPIEQSAESFASQALAPMKRRSQIRRLKRKGNVKAVRRLKRKPLPTVDTSQFSQYLGSDPTQIRY